MRTRCSGSAVDRVQQVDPFERREREAGQGVGDGLVTGDAKQVGGGVSLRGYGEGGAQGSGELGVVRDGQEAVADQVAGGLGGVFEVVGLGQGGVVEAEAVLGRGLGGGGHGEILPEAYVRGTAWGGTLGAGAASLLRRRGRWLGCTGAASDPSLHTHRAGARGPRAPLPRGPRPTPHRRPCPPP